MAIRLFCVLIMLFFAFDSHLLWADDSDLFQSPPAAITNTKYTHDCGGVTEDLEPQMPPIVNQEQSPWCATFADKALLEYQFHVTHPGDHYENLLSSMDMTSLDTEVPTTERGKNPSVNGGSNEFTLLEGVQATGKIYSEQNFPFDQSYFDTNGIMDQLSVYYMEEKSFASTSPLECRTQNDLTRNLESQFSSIFGLLKTAKNIESFLAAATAKFPIVPKPKAGALRGEISPFNIRDVNPGSGDQFLDELRRNLQAKVPSLISLCSVQLVQQPGFARKDPIPPEMKQNCGAHAINVVGMKTEDGHCKIEIRTSWGKDWPVPPISNGSEGTAWINATDLLKLLVISQDTPEIVSIRPRGIGEKIQNVQIIEDQTYTGETYQGQPNGNGVMIGADGMTAEGTFSQGTLVNGTFKGVWDTDKGLHYEGPIVNGDITPKGRLTDKEGRLASP